MMSKDDAVAQEQLVTGFRGIGLERGDGLIIHSSLRSLGYVDGGADTVLDALLEVIGPDGNLMLPTFNYTRPLPEPYYDPAVTPGRTGIIPETGRQRPGAVRSLHPTHSVAVVGPDAAELTRDHLVGRAFGTGSPIDRLAQTGGKVLLLGVGHVSNSMIHVAEEYAELPKASAYPEPLPSAKVLMPDSTERVHQLDTSCSCSASFGGAELALRRDGLIRDARFGSCLTQIVDSRALIECVVRMMAEQPDVLLCTRPECEPCIGTRENLRALGRLS